MRLMSIRSISSYVNRKLTWNLNRIEVRHNSYEINLKIDGVNLNNYIQHLKKEFISLTEKNEHNHRLVELQPVINILQERDAIIENISSLGDLLTDKDAEIKSLAEDEKASFEKLITIMDKKLMDSLLPKDKEEDIGDMVLEISAGVGGQEAMLFAGELFDMYCNYSSYKGWDFDIAEYIAAENGGVRHASALIAGRNVFRSFKQEAGVHRVQRVPETEKSGRIHTSTVSVVALPQPDDIDINIENKDLKIETKRASGAGGQHVNTTDSAVRIVHLPTGIAVECQQDRSQIKNRRTALLRLRAKLYEIQMNAQTADVEATRKSQVRSNFRNEKIRTYNFGQDRITDHRLDNGNSLHNLKVFMQGGEPLDDLVNKLNHVSKLKILKDIVNSIN